MVRSLSAAAYAVGRPDSGTDPAGTALQQQQQQQHVQPQPQQPIAQPQHSCQRNTALPMQGTTPEARVAAGSSVGARAWTPAAAPGSPRLPYLLEAAAEHAHAIQELSLIRLGGDYEHQQPLSANAPPAWEAQQWRSQQLQPAAPSTLTPSASFSRCHGASSASPRKAGGLTPSEELLSAEDAAAVEELLTMTASQVVPNVSRPFSIVGDVPETDDSWLMTPSSANVLLMVRSAMQSQTGGCDL